MPYAAYEHGEIKIELYGQTTGALHVATARRDSVLTPADSISLLIIEQSRHPRVFDLGQSKGLKFIMVCMHLLQVEILLASGKKAYSSNRPKKKKKHFGQLVKESAWNSQCFGVLSHWDNRRAPGESWWAVTEIKEENSSIGIYQERSENPGQY